MKVTKIGTKPSDRQWVGECRSCKSEAIATESEMTSIVTDPRDGISLSRQKCPVCGAIDMIFYPDTSR